VIRDAPYDLIYLNSFFSVFAITTLLLRRFGAVRRKPIVLAHRGELSTGALGLKRTKKKLFVTLARWTGLHRGVIWQASSEMEREEIQAYDEGPTVITPNIPARVDIEQEDLASKPPKAAGEARFVFLSRIAKKKNLDYALGLLEGVEGRVVFDIYGTREDREYLDRCAELMNRLPASVRARYVGPVPPDEVHATLQGYHFFLFPTLNENFGHVILEALLAGLPVLTSDQTYWRGLEAASAGWDLRLEDREQFAARVRECVAMGADRYRRMSRSAHDLARRYLEDPRGVDATRRLLLDAVAGRAGGARSPRDVAPS
jgi:glycosyltransferase involved in cell wall biosynthesis